MERRIRNGLQVPDGLKRIREILRVIGMAKRIVSSSYSSQYLEFLVWPNYVEWLYVWTREFPRFVNLPSLCLAPTEVRTPSRRSTACSVLYLPHPQFSYVIETRFWLGYPRAWVFVALGSAVVKGYHVRGIGGLHMKQSAPRIWEKIIKTFFKGSPSSLIDSYCNFESSMITWSWHDASGIDTRRLVRRLTTMKGRPLNSLLLTHWSI
jgi:hypothetical protein